jgi:hypothetical protein
MPYFTTEVSEFCVAEYFNERMPPASLRDRIPEGARWPGSSYLDATTAGGFHVPSPAGKIEGGVSFGQYRRITR